MLKTFLQLERVAVGNLLFKWEMNHEETCAETLDLPSSLFASQNYFHLIKKRPLENNFRRLVLKGETL